MECKLSLILSKLACHIKCVNTVNFPFLLGFLKLLNGIILKEKIYPKIDNFFSFYALTFFRSKVIEF